ncbi:hypothetical protein [Sphingomonas adhaesiva]|uniref:hypothetical protein n=1 Tax=Sphingomonas adhaesiva TaxID=28212 RepID=UPI002FF845AD
MRTIVDDPMYRIRVDVARRLMDLDLRGLWDQAIAGRFLAHVVEAMAVLNRAGCAAGQQAALVDITGFVVQTQDIVGMIQGMLADPRLATRRLAVVVTAPLLKMQAKRVSSSEGFFATREEAETWLFVPEGADHSA